VSRSSWLSGPPKLGSLQTCATRFADPLDCSTKIDDQWTDVTTMEQRTAVDNGATYLPVKDWFCDRHDRCPGFVGSLPVTVDGHHLSIAYSRSLAPLIAKGLKPFLTRPSGVRPTKSAE
jgi:hypothetical protein